MPLTGNVISVPLTGNVMDLHPIRLVKFDQSNAFNRQCNLNVFTPKLTSLVPLTGNVISMYLHPIRLVEFDWSNAFNRQCKLNGFTPKSTSIYLSEFPPNLTSN